jgi:hypothetical protein
MNYQPTPVSRTCFLRRCEIHQGDPTWRHLPPRRETRPGCLRVVR